MKRINFFDFVAISILILISLLVLYRFDVYPIFIDIYYHLTIMRSIDQAGGVVIWDFLQFAPAGRMHLYPPFLHLLMLFLYKLGIDALNIGKFFSALMYPLTLGTVWYVCRELFSKKTGLLSILCLISSSMFLEFNGIVVTSALATILILWCYFCVYKGRFVSAIVFLTFSFYAHLSVPYIFIIPLLTWAVIDETRRKFILKTVAFSAVLFLPWLLILIYNLHLFGSFIVGNQNYISLLLLFPSIPGVYLAIKKIKGGRPQYILLPALVITIMPMYFTYVNRFWFHLLMPLAILSAIFLEFLIDKISFRFHNNKYVPSISIVLLCALFFTQNIVYMNYENDRYVPDKLINPPTSLESLYSGIISHKLNYLDPDSLAIIDIIMENTSSDDVVHTDKGGLACFISAMTSRPTTNGMYKEIQSVDPNPPDYKKIYVLEILAPYQIPDTHSTRIGSRLVIIRDEGTENAKRSEIPPSFPYELALLLIFIGIGMIVFDLIGFDRLKGYLN